MNDASFKIKQISSTLLSVTKKEVQLYFFEVYIGIPSPVY